MSKRFDRFQKRVIFGSTSSKFASYLVIFGRRLASMILVHFNFLLSSRIFYRFIYQFCSVSFELQKNIPVSPSSHASTADLKICKKRNNTSIRALNKLHYTFCVYFHKIFYEPQISTRF